MCRELLQCRHFTKIINSLPPPPFLGRTQDRITCSTTSHAMEIPAAMCMFTELKNIRMKIIEFCSTLLIEYWKYNSLYGDRILLSPLKLHALPGKFQVSKFFHSSNFNLKAMSTNIMTLKKSFNKHTQKFNVNYCYNIITFEFQSGKISSRSLLDCWTPEEWS